MRFGTFVFPVSQKPDNDYRIIHETLNEIQLCDELGFDTAWLSEHHFDGATAYVDPVVFAASIAATTKKIRIGFAVVEMALHHPVRLAAQTALLDNLSNGRLLVGTGKGSAFNEYEYIGFGVPMSDAAESLQEAENLILEAWQGNPVNFSGKYWDVAFPGLRPTPYQTPHPPLIRACLSEESTREMARIHRPILIGAQDNDSISNRIHLYRKELEDANLSDQNIETLLDKIWVSKNVFVADTSSEAIERAQLGLNTEQNHFRKAREEFNPSHTITKKSNPSEFQSTFIAGNAEDVYEQILELKEIGVSNLMMKMNTGEMEPEIVRKSIKLFSEDVMSRF
ncbi:LLM class flavin-dependent oxidoreductase [SAR202 cluster bacterium AC-647-P02_OGT_505m]|nr:LLM class flavin-dependent oxidoreductase [SAR202 cluster bacterium AC-647-P02_OGT_505m]